MFYKILFPYLVIWRKTVYLFFSFIFLAVAGKADVTLPSVLSNHAVLQQKSKVSLWGKAKPSSIVNITTSWDGKAYRAKSNSKGEFSQLVQTPVAGGPYYILFNDGEEKRVENILIGEVWFCSGQSNMEMPMAGFKNQSVLHSEDIINASSNNQIRIYKAERAISETPLKDGKGNWQQADPEVVRNTSAVAYQFARMLQDSLKIPVGIIVSSWGGTPIRAWMSSKSLQGITDNTPKAQKISPQNPSTLYNAMVSPYINYSVRGFLWYQGENDHQRADQYKNMMPAMVNDWRKKFNNKNMPFYFVEIAPWRYPNDTEIFSPYFREMQLELSKTVKNSGIAITADIGSDKTIHPPDKTTVADRLLRLALANTYGYKQVKYRGPEIGKVTVERDKIYINFLHADSGLLLKTDETNNFEIAGNDRIFHEASCKINGNVLELWSSKVQEPVAVRYAFKDYFRGNLFNKEGLPAASFRTKW